MAFKMKAASMHDTSSKHGTNANYTKSGAPGLATTPPLPAPGGVVPPPVDPNTQAGPIVDPNAAPVAATPVAATPVAPAIAANPAVAEEAVPMQKRKGAPKLVGKQKNIDKNKNGKIDAGDFKAMKNGPTKKYKY